MIEQVTPDIKQFHYLMSALDNAYHDAAAKLGLSDSVLRILYAFCDGKDQCLLQDIVQLSSMSKQTVNSALRKMEADGVLYLEAFDGRKKMVCLTEKGRELVHATAMPIIEKEISILSDWNEQERRFYITMTERYLAALKEKFKEL